MSGIGRDYWVYRRSKNLRGRLHLWKREKIFGFLGEFWCALSQGKSRLWISEDNLIAVFCKRQKRFAIPVSVIRK